MIQKPRIQMFRKLTAHYDEETAEYVWAELAYSMRGTPNDRLVLMDSATGRGKTTLMKAVTAAIGDYGSKAHRSVIAMDDKRNAGQANPAMFALTSPARVLLHRRGRERYFRPRQSKEHRQRRH